MTGNYRARVWDFKDFKEFREQMYKTCGKGIQARTSADVQ